MKTRTRTVLLPTPPTGPLMTESDAAAYLKLSQVFLQKDRRGKRLIPYVQIGRAVRYRQTDLDAAIQRMVVRAI